MKLTYLASPYYYRGDRKGLSDSSIAIIHEERYQAAIDACHWLMANGKCVISPIVATHPVAVKHGLPLGSEYWMQFDEILLKKCDEMYMLMIHGVLDSPGVAREFEIMKNMKKETKLLIPDSENRGPEYTNYFINDMDWETRDCLDTMNGKRIF